MEDSSFNLCADRPPDPRKAIFGGVRTIRRAAISSATQTIIRDGEQELALAVPFLFQRAQVKLISMQVGLESILYLGEFPCRQRLRIQRHL